MLAGAGALPFEPSADALFAEAMENLDRAPVLDLTSISLSRGATSLVGSLEADRHGNAELRVTLGGSYVEAVVVGGRTYARADKPFWATRVDAALAKVLAGRWVVAPGDPLEPYLGELTRPGALGAPFRLTHRELARQPPTTLEGKPVVKLTNRVGDVYLTATRPTLVLRLAYAAGFTDSSGIRDLRADLAYPKTLQVTAPAEPLDPSNPSTLPARFLYVGPDTSFPPCDPAACRLGATVRNEGGKSVGQATLTFSAHSADGSQDLGSCTTPIPPIDNGRTETVSCTIVSPALQAYYNSGRSSFRYLPSIHNPIWDD